MGVTFNDATPATGGVGYLLSEARTAMLQAVKVSGQSFDTDEQDRALITAFERFLLEVPASTADYAVNLAQGASTLDLTATDSAFSQNDFLDRAAIGHARVRLAPWGMVQRRWAGGTPAAGQPTLIAFRSDDHALFDKPADQAYTLTVVLRRGLVSFTPGTEDAVTLNVPAHWGPLIARTGGAAHLLGGAHIVSGGAMNPKAASLYEQFLQIIEAARPKFAPTVNGVLDKNVARGA